ncbi:MAG TPA: FtsX-like permease family protein [Candidatus Acidoferrum sp.]|nr:FtsX-like permease family protein [Candidatus Acidoferrum sp.]
MMPDRKMFWRILRRLLAANRGRLFVILLALGAGAAITAALLNLQVDARRRLTTEFRAFGANVVIAPSDSGTSAESPRFLNDSLFADLTEGMDSSNIPKAEFLYGVVDIARLPAATDQQPGASTKAILAGLEYSGSRPEQVLSPALVSVTRKAASGQILSCAVGPRAAAALQLHNGEILVLTSDSRELSCRASVLPSMGSEEDSQIFLDLRAAQTLLEQPGRISLIQLSVPGTPRQIQSCIDALRSLPGADVRPIRQFTEGEAKIYNRISGILSATVGLVLLLTALCVMAAMTNVAMERRNDVGLMKAIGGATRRVLRLFLAEAALLGLTGGILGAAIGILLSMWLGKAVFGVAARPRLIVYPVAVALTIIVAIAGAYPLRRLANIRPAAVFRGEA